MRHDTVLSPQVEQIGIDQSNDNQRIDNFLIKYLKGVPKSRIYRIIRKGEVRVNCGRVSAKYRLQQGDRVRIPPIRVATPNIQRAASEKLNHRLKNRILYEDDFFLVLNKPSGIAVHGGSGVNAGLVESLRLAQPSSKFLELVHRLDKETSGCIILAKKRSCLRTLHEMFREDKITKIYCALICGRLPRKKMLIDVPLQKNVGVSGERIVKADLNGKTCKTLFRQQQTFESVSMISAELLTGRTHQIRVHASHIGHPIIGDNRYGNKLKNREFKRYGLQRLFLHASTLRLRHPQSGEPITINAPLDSDLLTTIDLLKNERSI